MEHTAVKYFAVASVLGMHIVRTKNRLQKALRFMYSFLFYSTMTIFNLYSVYIEYLDIFLLEISGNELTVYSFVMVYHITLTAQLLFSLHWLLTKSQDFSQILKQIDNFADELSCKELLAKHVRRLDAIFSFLVSPALCALVTADAFTYSYAYIQNQMIENCYGCAVVAIWQWKMIMLVSSMRVVICKLNANLKVQRFNYLNFKFWSVFLAARSFALTIHCCKTNKFTEKHTC